jgi:hypothetical protein
LLLSTITFRALVRALCARLADLLHEAAKVPRAGVIVGLKSPRPT